MMENIDDELEKYLKDSFDDFEVEPSATFWGNLEESLPVPEKDWRRPLYVLLLVVVGSIGFLWLKYSDSKPSTVSGEVKKNRHDFDKSVSVAINTEELNTSKSNNSEAKNYENTNQNTVVGKEQTLTKNIEESKMNIVETSKNRQIRPHNSQKSVNKADEENLETASNIITRTAGNTIPVQKRIAKNSKSYEENFIDKNTTKITTGNEIVLQKQTPKNEESYKENFITNESEINTLKILEVPKAESIEKIEKNIAKIDLLNYKYFNTLAKAFVLPQPKFLIVEKPKKNAPKLPLQWTIGAEISNTYQNIKVVNYSEFPLLTINNPAIFASQRRSMQFSVGIIKPTSPNANIRVNASLITLKQWTDYDTFSGSYKATNLGQDKYEITQVSSNYSNIKTFKYLSLGINRQIFILKTPTFRFFISGGVEGLLPLGKQSAQYGLTASVGLQQKINEKIYFTIAPNFSYFLNKNTYDTNHLTQILPYTIGLKGNLGFSK